MNSIDLNLDERITAEITVYKGDTMGPIQFSFEQAIGLNGECIDYTEDEEITFIPEPLTGAIFEGELLRGRNIIHMLSSSELTFYDDISILLFQLDSSLMKKLGTGVIHFNIRQILDDVVTTRVSGVIIIVPNV